MADIQSSFDLDYHGSALTLTPIIDHEGMKYLVDLPTRVMMIEATYTTDFDLQWLESPATVSQIAQEIGALIEDRFM